MTPDRLRIRRYDAHNLVIEYLKPGGLTPITHHPGPARWVILGYYGRLPDLAAALLGLTIGIPPGDDLREQIAAIAPAITAAEKRILDVLLSEAIGRLDDPDPKFNQVFSQLAQLDAEQNQ